MKILENLSNFFLRKATGNISNFVGLGVVQISNQIVSLISIPLLIRTLGMSNYGTLVFYQSIAGYFSIVIGYSFSFLAVNQIATSRHHDSKIKIINEVLSARFILTLLSILVLSILSYFNQTLREISLVTSIVYLCSIAVQMDWLYQGIQDNQRYAIYNLIGKVASLIWLFIMVRRDDCINESLIFFSTSNLVIALMTYFFLKKKIAFQFSFSKLKSFLGNLKTGFSLFVSSVLGFLYSADFNIAWLGLSGHTQGIAEFGVAYKVFLLAGSIGGMVSTLYIPKLANYFAESRLLYEQEFRKSLYASVLFLIIIAIGVYLLADTLVWLICGKNNYQVVKQLKLLCIVLPISPLGPILNQSHILRNRSVNLLYSGIFLSISNLILLYCMQSILNYHSYSLTMVCIAIHFLILFIQLLLIHQTRKFQ